MAIPRPVADAHFAAWIEGHLRLPAVTRGPEDAASARAHRDWYPPGDTDPPEEAKVVDEVILSVMVKVDRQPRYLCITRSYLTPSVLNVERWEGFRPRFAGHVSIDTKTYDGPRQVESVVDAVFDLLGTARTDCDWTRLVRPDWNWTDWADWDDSPLALCWRSTHFLDGVAVPDGDLRRVRDWVVAHVEGLRDAHHRVFLYVGGGCVPWSLDLRKGGVFVHQIEQGQCLPDPGAAVDWIFERCPGPVARVHVDCCSKDGMQSTYSPEGAASQHHWARDGEAFRELMAKTWHPSRVVDWCMDTEERACFDACDSCV